MLTEFNEIILNEASATRTEDFIVKSSLNLISLKMRKYTQKTTDSATQIKARIASK